MKRAAACQGIVSSTGIHFTQPGRLEAAWRSGSPSAPVFRPSGYQSFRATQFSWGGSNQQTVTPARPERSERNGSRIKGEKRRVQESLAQTKNQPFHPHSIGNEPFCLDSGGRPRLPRDPAGRTIGLSFNCLGKPNPVGGRR
jgi:hypothetical protein